MPADPDRDADVGLNTFTDAIARVALGIERAEKVIAEAAGTGLVSEIPT